MAAPGAAKSLFLTLLLSLLALLALLTLLAAGVRPAEATPLYMARSGRTCDNCHSLPNSWFNPPETTLRKCTLGCASCHVDPNGGGLRNVSGRYYGASTLPMFAATGRPYKDVRRELAWLFGGDATRGEPSSEPSSEPTSGQGAEVATTPMDPRPAGSPEPNDGPVWGRPIGRGSSDMAWLDGRYGDQNADPFVLFGADVRLGVWQQGPLVFPMQADLDLAVHPVEHFTLATATGLRGRASSRGSDRDDGAPWVDLRDLWVMAHELPALAYVRAGRFLPAFGTRISDHTAYTRRPFGLSQEFPSSRVLGAEVGFNANYPYANVTAFVPTASDAANPFEVAEGWGGVASAGWRDLGWSLGGSAMVRRRALDNDGDTFDLSAQWSFNPWFYTDALPVTYLGEVAFGTLQRRWSGVEMAQLAAYHRLVWTALAGVQFEGRYDFWDPDREVVDDDVHRPGVATELTIVPGLTVRADVRLLVPARGQAGADLFVQLHGWL